MTVVGDEGVCASSFVIAAQAAIHDGCHWIHSECFWECFNASPGHYPDVPHPRRHHVSAMKRPCVYILASKRDGILYVGVTSDLWQRMSQHVQHLFEGFTAKYNVTQLVYYEWHATMDEAIVREKQLKNWQRAWKVRLVHETNREWRNLYNFDTSEIEELPHAIELAER